MKEGKEKNRSKETERSKSELLDWLLAINIVADLPVRRKVDTLADFMLCLQ